MDSMAPPEGQPVGVQIMVVITSSLRAWVDTSRDQPPILGLTTDNAEVCLTFDGDVIDPGTVRAVCQFADQVTAFADLLRTYQLGQALDMAGPTRDGEGSGYRPSTRPHTPTVR